MLIQRHFFRKIHYNLVYVPDCIFEGWFWSYNQAVKRTVNLGSA